MPPFKKPKIEIFEDETTGVRKARIGQKEFRLLRFQVLKWSSNQAKTMGLLRSL